MNPLNKWKIGLYLSVIFLAGAVTGSFITIAVGRHMMFGPQGQKRAAARWLGELDSKLSLTPEQAQKISPIINEAMTTFRTTFTDQMLTSLSNCNARIAGELTAEQRVKFEEVKRQQQEFIRKGFQGGTESPQKKP